MYQSMKRKLLLVIALMLCCATTMFAQNDKISYQAVVRSADNHLVVNTDLTVTVSLANSENGPVVYKETHAVTSNMNGLISLLIGDGTPVDGSWADIQWSNAWVTADIACGGTHIATHKMPLNAVPYALQAGYADSVNTDVIANYLATHTVPGVSNVQSDWNQTDESSDAYIKNKPSIRDSVSNYLTNNHYVTETVMSGAIHDSIVNNIQTNINNTIHDSITTNVTKLIHDSIVNNVNANIGEAIHDSIVNNIAGQISDSLNNYHIQNCDDVNACVTAALADGTSDLNRAIDTIAGNVIHDSIANNVTKLIHDSITNNVTKLIHDSIANNITNTITNNISSQIHDSLSGYDIKDCADVNACVANSLADGTSALNQIVDSIAGNTIHDSIVNHISTQIRDSVSNYLTNNHYVTETVMSGAIHDSITNNISSQIHDSITNLAGRIPAVNDATFTVAIADGTTTTFTANSATDATVTLAKVAGTGSYKDLTDTPTNLVTTDGANTYTGANDFTGGTTTVASGFTMGTTTTANCGNVAVNACDLLAVFDSLNRRIQGVFDSLKHLNDSLAEELAALSPTLTLTSDLDGGSVNLCGNSSVEVVYTATLNNANAADYTFAWTVGGVAQSETGSTLTYTYTAAATDVKVVCVATRAGSAALKDSLTTTVTTGGTAVSLGLCDNYLTVTVKSVSGSPTSISWGDGRTGTSVSADMTHTYSTSGTYTITATNSDGCKATYTLALAEAAHTTCTVTSRNSNEMGSSATVIDSVKDHEGNWYEVVQIGDQCWLKENLRTRTSPKTGTRLVNTAGKTDNNAAQYYGSKVAHWYMNDSTTYAPKGYGLLYNWCAVMDTANPSNYMEVPTASAGNTNAFDFAPSGNHRGICPEGWHVPTDAEWSAMELEVNGSDVSSATGYRGSHAGKLSTGCDWVSSTNAGAPGNFGNTDRNSSGFAAVPAGNFYSSFNNAGYYAGFWSSSQGSSSNAWGRNLYCNYAGVYRYGNLKYDGRSVRCLRD